MYKRNFESNSIEKKRVVIRKKNLRLATCQVKLRLNKQNEVIEIGTKKKRMKWADDTQNKKRKNKIEM